MFSHRVKSFRLSELGDFIKGHGTIKFSDLEESGVPCLRYGEIYTTYGEVTTKLNSCVSSKLASKCTPLLHGDIVFVASGETAEGIGKAVAWMGSGKSVVGSDIIILRNHGQNPAFLGYALNSYDVVKQKFRLGKGRSVVHIHTNELASLVVNLPSLSEQRKIVEILTCWDKAIEQLSLLQLLEEKYYESLVNNLVLNIGFERQNILHHLSHVTTKNIEQRITRVLSVTNSAGFILAENLFSHRVASGNLSKYKIVEHGDFAFNPSRINVGSIARMENWDIGVVSPMYVVFRVNETIMSDYLFHWLSSSEAKQRIRIAAQGSVRETVSFESFGKIKIPIPKIEQQRKIADALNNKLSEIRLIDQLIRKYQTQKSGLIQNLL